MIAVVIAVVIFVEEMRSRLWISWVNFAFI